MRMMVSPSFRFKRFVCGLVGGIGVWALGMEADGRDCEV